MMKLKYQRKRKRKKDKETDDEKKRRLTSPQARSFNDCKSQVGGDRDGETKDAGSEASASFRIRYPPRLHSQSAAWGLT